MHANRAATWQSLDRALQAGASKLADLRSGQKGLFDDGVEESPQAADQSLPHIDDWPEPQRLANEKEVLGFYLSSHPLAEHQNTLAAHCQSTSAITGLPKRSEVMLGGIVSSIKLAHTKNPREGSTLTKYAMFDLEDLDGIIRCIAWPEEFARLGQFIESDAIVALRGSVDRRPGSEESNLIVNDMFPLADLSRRAIKSIIVRVFEETHGAAALETLREIVAEFPGNCEFQILLGLPDGSRVHLNTSLRVDVTAEFRSRVELLLGPGNIKTISAPLTSTAPHAHNGKSHRRPAEVGS